MAERIPIQNSIGRPRDPSASGMGGVAQQILGSAMATASGPMIDPNILSGAPPWAVYLMNATQNMQVELAALRMVLHRRRVVTEEEYVESLAEIGRIVDEQFRQSAAAIERTMNQRPTQPADPRRSPTP